MSSKGLDAAQVLPVVRGITEIFLESDVLRHDREKARLKFLFLQHGWTAERFKSELERRIGFSLDPGVAAEPPDDVYRDHVGIHPQKQAGYVYAGMSVLRGRLTVDQMRAAGLRPALDRGHRNRGQEGKSRGTMVDA
jgi:sulfite reductase (ferredoxin)